ncbi:MAG: ribosomal protein S18-alanine N-acetyltransferase [Gammaproteobacteria bacterium]|jgi:ribosomal-protein-alanine N-acetyltransferase|nr:ribosomal protein S18-alanine N-acetyltransferase [Gammaproteobacteria bacterium]
MSARPDLSAATANLRTMRPADLDAVVEIEQRAYAFPWSRNIFQDCLLAGYHCRVLEQAAGPVGYSILSTAAGEAHILNLCVDPAHQRLGFGGRLLAGLLAYAGEAHIDRMFLEVRPSNQAAISLYQRAGFVRLGVRKAYYRTAGGREDALVLVRTF